MRDTATGRALLAEGRAEGRAEERRRTILLVLELRLGTVPAWVAQRLQTESKLDRLEALLLGARGVGAVTELEALFGPGREAS